jgi:hypothetical protein
MPRMQALPPETTPELKAHFDFFLGTLVLLCHKNGIVRPLLTL